MDTISLFKDALKHSAMHYNSLSIYFETESSGVPRHQQNACKKGLKKTWTF